MQNVNVQGAQIQKRAQKALQSYLMAKEAHEKAAETSPSLLHPQTACERCAAD